MRFTLLSGRDLLATAQTGTGKTAAFAVPILQHLHTVAGHQKHHQLRVLILAPTRELVAQIKESFINYGAHLSFSTVAIFGGVPKAGQIKAIRKGCDILVATPGRLFDIINTIDLDLNAVKFFVLDEADRMLDMGFSRDVEKIVTYLPEEKQTMLFSATMPKEIVSLANRLLKDPVRIHEDPGTPVVEQIAQSVYLVGRRQKKDLLIHLLQDSVIYQAIVFSRTKRGADRISKTLNSYGITNATLHGNKSQNIREQALKAFKHNDVRVLVATDIAARGIDIQELSHVINYDIPEDPESYIHRIGRTGRAGSSGTALSFCEPGEVRSLRDIEKLIGNKIPVVKGHPYEATFKNQALDLTGILPEPLHALEEEAPSKPRGERSKRTSAPTTRKRTVRKDATNDNPVDTFFKEETNMNDNNQEASPKIFKRKEQSEVYSETDRKPERKSYDRYSKKKDDRFGDKPQRSSYRGSSDRQGEGEARSDRKPRFGSRKPGEGYQGERKNSDRRYGAKPYGEKSYGEKSNKDASSPDGFEKKTDSRPRRSYDRKPYEGEKRTSSFDRDSSKRYGESRGSGRSEGARTYSRGPRVENGESRKPSGDRRRSFDKGESSFSSEGRSPRSETRSARPEGRSFAKGPRQYGSSEGRKDYSEGRSNRSEGRSNRSEGRSARPEGRSYSKPRGASSTAPKRTYNRRKD